MSFKRELPHLKFSDRLGYVANRSLILDLQSAWNAQTVRAPYGRETHPNGETNLLGGASREKISCKSPSLYLWPRVCVIDRLIMYLVLSMTSVLACDNPGGIPPETSTVETEPDMFLFLIGDVNLLLHAIDGSLELTWT